MGKISARNLLSWLALLISHYCLHLVGCLYYLYQRCTVKQISDDEIYLLIKYIKIFLWRVAKRLSYMEDARCLKVNIFTLNSMQRSGCHIRLPTCVILWLVPNFINRLCDFQKRTCFRLMAGPCVLVLFTHAWTERTLSLYTTTPNIYAATCGFFFFTWLR